MKQILFWISDHWVVMAATLGLIVAGSAPAITFAVTTHHALINGSIEWGNGMAWAAAWGLGLTAEFLGAISGHVATRSRNQKHRTTARNILIAYSVIGTGYFLFFSKYDLFRELGTMAYIFAGLIYYAVSMYFETIRTEELAQERDAKKKAKEGIRQAEAVAKSEEESERQRLDDELRRKMEYESHLASLAERKDASKAKQARLDKRQAAKLAQTAKVQTAKAQTAKVQTAKVQTAKVQTAKKRGATKSLVLKAKSKLGDGATLGEIQAELRSQGKELSLSSISRHLKEVR